jgi:hypothetical protein
LRGKEKFNQTAFISANGAVSSLPGGDRVVASTMIEVKRGTYGSNESSQNQIMCDEY